MCHRLPSCSELLYTFGIEMSVTNLELPFRKSKFSLILAFPFTASVPSLSDAFDLTFLGTGRVTVHGADGPIGAVLGEILTGLIVLAKVFEMLAVGMKFTPFGESCAEVLSLLTESAILPLLFCFKLELEFTIVYVSRELSCAKGTIAWDTNAETLFAALT